MTDDPDKPPADAFGKLPGTLARPKAEPPPPPPENVFQGSFTALDDVLDGWTT